MDESAEPDTDDRSAEGAAPTAEEADEPALVLGRRAGPRVRLGVGAALALVLLALGVAVLVSLVGPHGSTRRLSPTPRVTSAGATAGAGTLSVHVTGSVRHSGFYTLPAGSRVMDAVAAAGGFSSKADRGRINLARALSDGEQVTVPAEGAPTGAPAAGADSTASGGAVDLNTASEQQLETLPRIGPAMAARILAYRKAHGGFRSVDELTKVSGIGEKTLAALRDLVTV